MLARIIESIGRAFMVPDANSLLPSILSIYETSVLTLVSEVDQYLDPGKPLSLNIDTEKRFTHKIWDLRSELVMIGDVLGCNGLSPKSHD
jgi:Ser-tRNA(Ala) deacylase AlaX